MNQFFKAVLLRTLWLWLPFYALQYLVKELMKKIEE
jgi:hypothetical protein